MPFDPSALPGDNPIGASMTSLAIASVSDYVLAFSETQVKYLVGESRPLKWSLSRADGTNCEVPTTATIGVTAPDGTNSTATPSLDTATLSLVIHLAALYIFALPGSYSAIITVTVNGETLKNRVDMLAS